jgi:hypothetical protein
MTLMMRLEATLRHEELVLDCDLVRGVGRSLRASPYSVGTRSHPSGNRPARRRQHELSLEKLPISGAGRWRRSFSHFGGKIIESLDDVAVGGAVIPRREPMPDAMLIRYLPGVPTVSATSENANLLRGKIGVRSHGALGGARPATQSYGVNIRRRDSARVSRPWLAAFCGTPEIWLLGLSVLLQRARGWHSRCFRMDAYSVR